MTVRPSYSRFWFHNIELLKVIKLRLALCFKMVIVVVAMSGGMAQANELIDLGEMPFDKYEDRPLPTPDFLFGYLGGVVINSKRIVGDKGDFTLPFPVFGINYKGLAYWNVTKGGAWLWKSRDRTLKFGPLLKLRLAVNTDNESQLAGLTKRKGSLEAGAGVSLFSVVKTTLAVYQDVSGRTDGASAELKVSKSIKLNDHISTIPFASLEWLSADVVDYYYGVNSLESTTSGIGIYTGRSTTVARGGVTLADHINQHWAVLGGLVVQQYGRGITDSPIVTKSNTTAFYVGATYLFLSF